MSMRKNYLFEEKNKQKKHFSTSVQFPPLKSVQELRQANLRYHHRQIRIHNHKLSIEERKKKET